MIINTSYNARGMMFFSCSYMSGLNNTARFISEEQSYNTNGFYHYEFFYKGKKIQSDNGYDVPIGEYHYKTFLPMVFDDLEVVKFFDGVSLLADIKKVLRYLNSGVFQVLNHDGERVPFLFSKSGESIVGYMFLHDSLQKQDGSESFYNHPLKVIYPFGSNSFLTYQEALDKGWLTGINPMFLGLPFPHLYQNSNGCFHYSSLYDDLAYHPSSFLSPIFFYKYALNLKDFIEEYRRSHSMWCGIDYQWNHFDSNRNFLICDDNHMKYIKNNIEVLEAVIIDRALEEEVFYA